MVLNQDLLLLKESDISIEYFRLHLDNFLNTFNNKFIAIKGEKVIESADKMDALIAKLSKKGEDTSKLLIKFISKNKFIL